MGPRYSVRGQFSIRLRRALALAMGTCAASAACDPGVFSRERAGGSTDTSQEAGSSAQPDSGAGQQTLPNAGRYAASNSGGESAPQGGKSTLQAGRPGPAAGKAGSAGGQPAPDGGVDAGPDSSMPPTVECAHARDPHAVTVTYAEAGAIAVPSWVSERSGAAATRVGDKAFAVFNTREGLVMAAWGRREGLLAAPAHYDDGKNFVPLFDADATPAEYTVGAASALEDKDSALVFFTALKGFYSVGTGIARVPVDAVRAQILRPASALSSGDDADAGAGHAPWEPPFTTGALAVRDGATDFVYLYGCGANPNAPDEANGQAHESPCRLARIPRADLVRAERFRYWDGRSFQADVARALPVVDHVGAPLSVSYNRYLGRYLALGSQVTSRVVLLSAERPEGPWEALGEASTLPSTGGFGTSFAAIELPALRSACDDVLYISYVRTPRVDSGGSTFITQLARIELH